MTARMEVLVVEDDAGTRSFLGALAEYAGFLPTYAADGKAALNRMEDGFTGLILLDLLIPVPDGFAIVRELKLTKPELLQRMIVVTAAHPQLVDACPELKDTWRIYRKPLEVEALRNTLVACAAAADKLKAGGQRERETR
jgi:CheY-like chemotaxis protein